MRIQFLRSAVDCFIFGRIFASCEKNESIVKNDDIPFEWEINSGVQETEQTKLSIVYTQRIQVQIRFEIANLALFANIMLNNDDDDWIWFACLAIRLL